MILILGALDQEIESLKLKTAIKEHNQWQHFSENLGNLADQEVCIVKCGVGKVLSAALCQHLIDKYKPKIILFTGLAGALSPNLNIGDIVIGTDCVQHNLDARALGFKRGLIPYTNIFSVSADSKLLTIAREFKSSNYQIHFGRLLSGDQFISHSDKESHAYLVDELNGVAVDMESASIALVSQINNIPFLIIRTISDKANGESPKDFNTFLPEASKHSTDLVIHLLKKIEALL